jgi:hypothetical protein
VLGLFASTTPAVAYTQSTTGTLYNSLTKFSTFRERYPNRAVYFNGKLTEVKSNNVAGYYGDKWVGWSACTWNLGLRNKAGTQFSRIATINASTGGYVTFPSTSQGAGPSKFAVNGVIACGYSAENISTYSWLKFSGTFDY